MNSQAVTNDVSVYAAGIVQAYLSRHDVPLENLQDLIRQTRNTLMEGSSAEIGAKASNEALLANVGHKGPGDPAKPIVPIKDSVQDDYIVCLEDGGKYKSLKRHLMVGYNMTPQEYTSKWGLPVDYPMVAPAYSRERSTLAQQIGLGRQPIPEGDLTDAQRKRRERRAARNARKAGKGS